MQAVQFLRNHLQDKVFVLFCNRGHDLLCLLLMTDIVSDGCLLFDSFFFFFFIIYCNGSKSDIISIVFFF